MSQAIKYKCHICINSGIEPIYLKKYTLDRKSKHKGLKLPLCKRCQCLHSAVGSIDRMYPIVSKYIAWTEYPLITVINIANQNHYMRDETPVKPRRKKYETDINDF